MWSKKCIFLKQTELQNLVLEKIETLPDFSEPNGLTSAQL